MTGLKLLMTADAVGGVWTYAIDLASGLTTHDVATTLAVLGPAPSARQLRQARSVSGLVVETLGLKLDWLCEEPAELERAADEVAVLAHRVGAELVHLNTPALAACADFERPTVAICHSCVRSWWEAVEEGAMPPPLAWQAARLAAGYAASDRLAAPSATFAETTRRLYDLPGPPVVIHNGRHPPTQAAGPMADFVFTAGRLWDRGKNVAALDRLAARLAWPVQAAGSVSGPDGSVIALRKIIALGLLDPEALAARLAQRPIFVSLARYEPFGLAVLEAAQAGCALVLADTAGFRELWDGAASFVPLDDDAAALAAIERLMTDRPGRVLAGNRAARHSARYGIDSMARQTMHLYRDALGRGAAMSMQRPA